MAGGKITEIAGGNIQTTVNNDFNVYGDTVQFNPGNKMNMNGDDSGVTFGNKPLDAPAVAGKGSVTKAYFAKKYEKKVVKSTEEYTVAKGDTQASIAKDKGVDKAEIPKKPVPGKKITIKSYENKFELKRIKSAILGSKIFLVAETTGLIDDNITFQIIGSNNTTFLKPGETASVLEGGAEKTEINAKVGAYVTKTEFETPEVFFKNKAVVEIEFKPKSDDTKKDWIKKINDSKEKAAFFHLTVKAQGEKEVTYSNEDDAIKGNSTDKGVFQNKADLWLKLKTCFCNRELEKDDLVSLGISDKKAGDFLDGMNAAIKNYEINTCIRIAHFVAQLKHESIEFTASKEIWGPTADQLNYEGNTNLGNTETGDGKKFMGRGLIQITGRANYTSYGTYKSVNFTDGENNLKMEQPLYAVDSAGWYWKVHLSPTNLNTYADDDDLIYVTYRINGGFNGYRDREKNLKKNLNAIGSCANKDLSTLGTYLLSTSKCNDSKDSVWKFANLLYGENDAHSGTETSKTAYSRYIVLANQALTPLKAKKKLTKNEEKQKTKLESQIATATERSQ